MASKRNNFDRSDLIAVSALLMSMLALFVSIYEARILKAQHKIMVSQERNAVWPYVDGHLIYQYTDKILIQYELENKGIGPSRIDQTQLSINDKVIENYDQLSKQLSAYFPDSVEIDLALVDMSNQILSPEEQVQILGIQISRFKNDIEVVRNFKVTAQVCYCSIYNECWYFEDRNEGKNLPCSD
ncbi:MAG: hypothetical protein KTR30_27730 [Saprospiraceae bacterium]|nr:hypothetical protein [Saprospiraceae bacterium]